jgi:LuxR family maltose regulon positive regulatory protein
MRAQLLQYQPGVDVDPMDGGGSDVGGGATVVPLVPRAARPVSAVESHRRRADQGLVLRRPLFDRLSGAGPVTTVTAPAGSGKTSLLRSWIAETGCQAAWSTVQRDERDGERFWVSLIDALASLDGLEQLPARIGAAPDFGGEPMLERLLAAIRGLRAPGVLVIDDLHELHSAEALRGLAGFLARLGPELRVVLGTREDHPLGLHRLRLAGALTEIRPDELRFSIEETRELLDAAGISLSDEGLRLLHERSEGWAAGLRLAAIALAGHRDPERFVSEFSGSERTIARYLLAEVLERQPPEVRDLLLRTSVCERVSGPLADALTGGSGSERILQELEDANAFVTSLDVGRSWFRYQRLFADLLRLELRRTNPRAIPALHAAAADWFEQHGDAVEAIRHAQAARDWSHAARLLADSYLDLVFDGRIATVRSLLDAFPPDSAATDPELALAFATARVFDGRDDESAAHVVIAERLAPTVAEDRRPLFELRLAGARLWLARHRGDLNRVPDASRSVEAALTEQAPGEFERNHVYRATAVMNLGIAELWSLRVDDGRRHLEQALAIARRIDKPYLEVVCLGYLALAAPLGGLPVSVSCELAEQAASIAETHGWDTHHKVATTFAVGGSAFAWLGRFAEAERWLQRAQCALAPGGAPGMELLLNHGRALLLLGQGRFEDALAAMRAAERIQGALLSEHPFTLDLRSRALRTQIQIGETDGVRAALAGLEPQSRERAEMRITAAAMELCDGRPERAIDELAPVIAGSARALHPAWSVIEALLFDALAHEQCGDAGAVGASLERALELAEPEGIVLPFALVEVRELLERHRGRRTAHPALLTTILDMLSGSAPASPAPALLDPLSEAELRVLRYLPSNLRSTEIAAELFVSSNTVRTHLRHIYAKLDAHSRTEAVARARQLGLLAPVSRLG